MISVPLSLVSLFYRQGLGVDRPGASAPDAVAAELQRKLAVALYQRDILSAMMRGLEQNSFLRHVASLFDATDEE